MFNHPKKFQVLRFQYFQTFLHYCCFLEVVLENWPIQIVFYPFQYTVARIQKKKQNKKSRRSHPETFLKKKFSGKLCKTQWKTFVLGSLFNKNADLQSLTLLKMGQWYRYFPVTFSKFLGAPFSSWSS